MGFFSFIENFFFISLGIVFILILLLVYHFKQRMSSVERKGDTMYEIMTNMLKEIRFMKGFYSEPVTEDELLPEKPTEPSPMPDRITYSLSDPPATENSTSRKIVVSDDESSSDGSISDSDEDSDEDDEMIDLEPDVIEMDVSTPLKYDTPSYLEEVVVVDPESREGPEGPVVTEEPAVTEGPEEHKKPSIEELKKMNINQLKSYAVTSGISVDTSKMKKNELITLLQST